AAGGLRPARPRSDHRVHGTLVGAAPAAPHAGGPGGGLLVGALDAPGRGLPHRGRDLQPPRPDRPVADSDSQPSRPLGTAITLKSSESVAVQRPVNAVMRTP